MKNAVSETLAILPEKPGCYLMKDKDGVIIYVGKAKILRNRVRSYFTGRKDIKTRVLVSHIVAIDFIVTSTEYEALLLENNLIKQHKPKYNIDLKDGKTYPVIRITNEDFPRVFRTRRIIEDGSLYFGPYTDLQAIDTYLDIIEEYFPLRKCKGPLKPREQPCLYYHIHRCSGPCAGKIDKQNYRVQVDNIRSMLEGDVEGLTGRLKTRMEGAATGLRFEEAAKLRDAMRALAMIGRGQQVQDFDTDSRDYVASAENEEHLSFVVFRMRDGKLVGTETFRTNGYSDIEEETSQFLLQYYGPEHGAPAKLFVGTLSDREAVQTFFSEQLKAPTEIGFPESSRDQAIMNMAAENARQDLSRWKAETGDLRALKDLQSVLGLTRLPMRIEGFDIAHLHGKHTVAAMVSFWKGIPDKNHYRIFNIRGLDGGIDDFESIREAVARRYTRVLNEELERPDLILIDGGKGQLSSAHGILEALGLGDIAICSLAKEEEEIFLPGQSESVRLPEGSPALRILQFVRDESHRFGTSRNQRLRSGDVRLSGLESIPGIGPGRAKKLLTSFGSISAILEAGVTELMTVGGLPKLLAETVLDALKGMVAKTGNEEINQLDDFDRAVSSIWDDGDDDLPVAAERADYQAETSKRAKRSGSRTREK